VEIRIVVFKQQFRCLNTITKWGPNDVG